MRNSGATFGVALSETGGFNAAGFASSLGGAAAISPATGLVVAGGTQSLTLGWSSYATTGPLTGTVTPSNTSNPGDPFNSSGNVINMTGAVVGNRMVTSTSASFGLVHVGAALSQGITLSTTGDDSYYTRVAVANGGTDNNGFLTVSGGGNPTFNSASVADNRTISGTANTPGVFNGAVTLTTIGEGLPGESPINVPVNYSVRVFSGQSSWVGGSNGSWGNPANWQDQVTPSISAVPGIWGVSGDTATLGSGSSGPATVTLDGTSPHLGNLTLGSTAGYTLASGSGGTLNIDNGPAAAVVTVAAGSHTIAAPVVLDSNTNVAANNAGDMLTVSGPVSGSGGLTAGGAGLLVLNAANTYSGGTTIDAGTLVLANSSGSAVGSGGILISGGTLQVGNGGTTGILPAGVTNNSVLAFDRSDALTLGGLIGGSGSLVQAGPGTLNLTGTVCNSTIVGNAGQLVLTPSLVFSGNLATGPAGRIQNNSSLQFGNLNNGGIFAGGGSLLGNFVNQSSGNVRIAAGQSLYLQNIGPQSNAGLIQVIGTGASQAQFESAGPFTNASGGGTGMIAAQNATLEFDGGLTNQAAVAFSYGVNNVFGTVTNSPSGNITVAGGAGVTFYGDVAQNGTLVDQHRGQHAQQRGVPRRFQRQRRLHRRRRRFHRGQPPPQRPRGSHLRRQRLSGQRHRHRDAVGRPSGGQPVRPDQRDRAVGPGGRSECRALGRFPAAGGPVVPVVRRATFRDVQPGYAAGVERRRAMEHQQPQHERHDQRRAGAFQPDDARCRCCRACRLSLAAA